MTVKVKLFGSLVDRLPEDKRKMPIQIELPEGATVGDIAEKLGIGDLGAVILINDQEGHRGKTVKDGDVVSFFPPLAGGASS
ncbi:MAG: MoaD/ThiS family protein [Armatimonadetes bacterium]|nr:MoaD/ThiS family protein [Armatimonadota bacterium]MDW8121901.1 MoaD/ThiS family protein [Armatimonadota bacterium]